MIAEVRLRLLFQPVRPRLHGFNAGFGLHPSEIREGRRLLCSPTVRLTGLHVRRRQRGKGPAAAASCSSRAPVAPAENIRANL